MKKPKLLIIDDDEALCESLRDIIELEGYVTETVHTGMDGIKKVKSGFYNIVLLDMKLPDSDGIKVLEEIKEISSDTEVIMFTAYAATGSVIEAMDKNAFSYLTKPFEIPHLKATLKNAYEKQKLSFERNKLLITLTALNKVSQTLSASLDTNKMLKGVLKEAFAITGFNIGTVCESFSGKHKSIATIGLSQKFVQEMDRKLSKDTPCGHVLASNKSVVIEKDLPEDSTVTAVAPILLAEGLKSYIGIPIRLQQKAIGVLSLFDTQPRTLTIDKFEILTAICNQLGSSIENHKLFQKVCDSKRDWEDTFDSILDLITIHDNDFNIIRYNNALVDKLNAKHEDIIGKKCYEVFHGRNEPWPACPFVRCKKSLKPESEEKKCLGGIFLMSCFPRFDEVGKFNGIVHIARDITERKRAGEELQNSQMMLQLVMDAIPTRVFWKDRESVYLGCNQLFAKDAGLQSPMQIIGKSDFELNWHEQAELYRSDDRQVIQTGTPKLNYEEPQTWPDGTKLWLRTSKIPLKDLSGSIIGVMGCYEDITERKQADEELEKHKNHLESLVNERTRELKDSQEALVRSEKLAMLGKFAGGVGHELRNPLGVINNSVYFLKMVLTDADDKVREYLEKISAEVNRSTNIISALMDFSRAKPANEKKEVVVANLLTLTLERIHPPENIEVKTDIPSDLPAVHVDPKKIEQVLLNLITNSYQAMPEGGRLTIAASAEKQYVNISIADTGAGISPENMDKIFEPLFTTKARGFGFGLALSRNLVESNGGSIEVKSEEGKGATFTVKLPIREAVS